MFINHFPEHYQLCFLNLRGRFRRRTKRRVELFWVAVSLRSYLYHLSFSAQSAAWCEITVTTADKAKIERQKAKNPP